MIKSGEDSQTDLSITEACLYNGSVEVVRTFTASDDLAERITSRRMKMELSNESWFGSTNRSPQQLVLMVPVPSTVLAM